MVAHLPAQAEMAVAKILDLGSSSRPWQLTSVLDGIAQSLPALIQAEKIQNRVSRHGFDWPKIARVFAKIEEELEEVREAFESGNAEGIG